MTNTPGTVRHEQALAHPPSRVWAFLTNPVLIAKWWVPCDLIPGRGQRFTLDMEPWGELDGEVLGVLHDTLLSYALSQASLTSVVTWTLRPTEEGTLLDLVHETSGLDNPMAQAAFTGMNREWPSILQRLATQMG